ncbi:MAG: OmpA family protein [Bacteroidetes bacterium]|nr:OmpA family protein [Bacteroidota bacterium]
MTFLKMKMDFVRGSTVMMTVALICCLVFPVSAQEKLTHHLYFEDGKSNLTKRSKNELRSTIRQLRSLSGFKITITGYLDSSSTDQQKRQLLDDRMDQIFDFLISNEMGHFVHLIKIIPVQGTTSGQTDNNETGRIDIRLVSKIPAIQVNETPQLVNESAQDEQDTILVGKTGARVIIKGGTFSPYKIYDFHYEIKEIMTMKELQDHNMSSMTTRSEVFELTAAIALWVLPKDQDIPVPEIFSIPVTFCIPVTEKSVKPNDYQVFRAGNGHKSYVVWKMTGMVPARGSSGDSAFLTITGVYAGYYAVGKILKPKSYCRLKLPGYTHHKISITYSHPNAVFAYEGSGNQPFRIPMINHASIQSISIYSKDKSGNPYYFYSADPTLIPDPSNRQKVKIRRKNFEKL